MEEDKKVISASNAVLTVVAVVVLTPIVVGVVATVATGLINVGIAGVNWVNRKRYISKGLKDGTVVKIGGAYYDVTVSDGDMTNVVD